MAADAPPHRAQAPPPTAPPMTAAQCSTKLRLHIDREQKLGLLQFFKDYNFDAYAPKGAEMYKQLVSKGCPWEMAEQFAMLVLYDLVILVDDSSSMDFEDDGRRKKTLKKVLDAIAEVYELARDEGIMSIRYLNGRQGRKDVTRDKVEDLHNAIQYNGVTMIGTQLQAKILKPFVEQKDMTKPLLIIVITDGSIEGERKGLLEKIIYNCLARLQQNPRKTVDAVAFMFARIGEDPGAKELLEKLDTDPKVGKWVDCLPLDSRLEDIGNGSSTHWMVMRKLMLGALDLDVDKNNDDGGDDGGDDTPDLLPRGDDLEDE